MVDEFRGEKCGKNQFENNENNIHPRVNSEFPVKKS